MGFSMRMGVNGPVNAVTPGTPPSPVSAPPVMMVVVNPVLVIVMPPVAESESDCETPAVPRVIFWGCLAIGSVEIVAYMQSHAVVFLCCYPKWQLTAVTGVNNE